MWKAFRVKQSLENGITEEKNKEWISQKADICTVTDRTCCGYAVLFWMCREDECKEDFSSVFGKYAEVTSSANHVELAIQMSDILDLMEVNMEMDLENTTEPPAGHAKGTAG